MFFSDFIFVLVLTLILTFVFAMGFRKHHFGLGILFFFLLLFLVTWAGGLWVAPFGPVLWGVNILTFLLIGFVVAILLTALLPPADTIRSWKSRGEEKEGEVRGSDYHVVTVDLFFFMLIIILAVLIIMAYV